MGTASSHVRHRDGWRKLATSQPRRRRCPPARPRRSSRGRRPHSGTATGLTEVGTQTWSTCPSSFRPTVRSLGQAGTERPCRTRARGPSSVPAAGAGPRMAGTAGTDPARVGVAAERETRWQSQRRIRRRPKPSRRIRLPNRQPCAPVFFDSSQTSWSCVAVSRDFDATVTTWAFCSGTVGIRCEPTPRRTGLEISTCSD